MTRPSRVVYTSCPKPAVDDPPLRVRAGHMRSPPPRRKECVITASLQVAQADSVREYPADRLLSRLGSELRGIRRVPYAADFPFANV
jgi:hypothetical protein